MLVWFNAKKSWNQRGHFYKIDKPNKMFSWNWISLLISSKAKVAFYYNFPSNRNFFVNSNNINWIFSSNWGTKLFENEDFKGNLHIANKWSFVKDKRRKTRRMEKSPHHFAKDFARRSFPRCHWCRFKISISAKASNWRENNWYGQIFTLLSYNLFLRKDDLPWIADVVGRNLSEYSIYVSWYWSIIYLLYDSRINEMISKR